MKKFLKSKVISALVVVAMLLGVATALSMKVPTMASTSCGQVLVKPSDWLGGHGVAVRSNGADMNTGNECDPDGEVYNLNANPPQYGFGWVCVELVNRLYVTKGWSARLTIPATYNGQKTYEGAKWLYTLAAAGYYPNLVAHANGSNYKPVPGDMIVHSNGTFGHVTVVDHISGNTLYAVDQNRSANGWESYTYNSSTGAVSMSGATISGYVHSTKNTGSGGSSVPRLAALQYNSEMNVYKLGSNNDIWKDTWQPSNNNWSGWVDMTSVSFAGDPAAIQFNSEMDVFAINSSGQLYKDTWQPSLNSWSGWNQLGSGVTLTGTPSAIQYSSTEMDVYARATNNQIYKETWNGTSWSGWNSLGAAWLAFLK